MAGETWVLVEQWRGRISEITFEALALGREVAASLGGGAPAGPPRGGRRGALPPRGGKGGRPRGPPGAPRGPGEPAGVAAAGTGESGACARRRHPRHAGPS